MHLKTLSRVECKAYHQGDGSVAYPSSEPEDGVAADSHMDTTSTLNSCPALHVGHYHVRLLDDHAKSIIDLSIVLALSR